jgi:hypothetical protein
MAVSESLVCCLLYFRMDTAANRAVVLGRTSGLAAKQNSTIKSKPGQHPLPSKTLGLAAFRVRSQLCEHDTRRRKPPIELLRVAFLASLVVILSVAISAFVPTCAVGSEASRVIGIWTGALQCQTPSMAYRVLHDVSADSSGRLRVTLDSIDTGQTGVAENAVRKGQPLRFPNSFG